MIDRDFIKRIPLKNGRFETIKTRFELSAAGLTEHVVLHTFDRPIGMADSLPADRPQRDPFGRRSAP